MVDSTICSDDGIGVANERTGAYRSLGSGFTERGQVFEANNDAEHPVPGPITIVVEACVYLPHDADDWTPDPIDPDAEVVVYDAFGNHGITRPGTGFESTREVRAWIDESLESESPGEYVIGLASEKGS